MHSRQDILELITSLGEEDLTLTIIDKFLQVQSHLLGIAIIVHRLRNSESHLFTQTEIVLCAQFGIQDNGSVVQWVDMLLPKLARRQSLNVNKLIEITLHTKLLLQTIVRIMRRLRLRLREKKFFYHKIVINLSDKT